MLLYLDLNCFNRPFDDQNQARVARETAAVFEVLQRIADGSDRLAWSAVLDFENAQHPLVDRRTEIARWAQRASVTIGLADRILARAKVLTEAGLTPLDAAHIASAEAAGCARLLTCDDMMIRRARRASLLLTIQTPVEYMEEHTNA